jgi:N6-adenosine-specific RNA methylase IME4
MAWHRINEYGQKKCIATGHTNDHSKQLILVVVNMTFSIHKELVYAPSHGKVNII